MDQLKSYGRFLRALALLAATAGCASSTVEQVAPSATASGVEVGVEGSPEQSSRSTRPDEAVEATRPQPDSSTATLALLQQSERAARHGELTEAIAYAERAVRLNGRQADLWIHLATLELENGDAVSAIAHAEKALTLTGNRTDWQKDAWMVIAGAKQAQGKDEEAREIRKRWQTARG